MPSSAVSCALNGVTEWRIKRTLVTTTTPTLSRRVRFAILTRVMRFNSALVSSHESSFHVRRNVVNKPAV